MRKAQSAMMDAIFFLMVSTTASSLLLVFSGSYGQMSMNALLSEYRYKYAHYAVTSILHEQNTMRAVTNDLGIVLTRKTGEEYRPKYYVMCGGKGLGIDDKYLKPSGTGAKICSCSMGGLIELCKPATDSDLRRFEDAGLYPFPTEEENETEDPSVAEQERLEQIINLCNQIGNANISVLEAAREQVGDVIISVADACVRGDYMEVADLLAQHEESEDAEPEVNESTEEVLENASQYVSPSKLFDDKCPSPRLSPCDGRQSLLEALTQIQSYNPTLSLQVTIHSADCETGQIGDFISEIYVGSVTGSSYSTPSFFVAQPYDERGYTIAGELVCYRLVVVTYY